MQPDQTLMSVKNTPWKPGTAQDVLVVADNPYIVNNNKTGE